MKGISIGRVGVRVLKALNAVEHKGNGVFKAKTKLGSFDPAVFISDEKIDAIAKANPENYLTWLSNMAEIIRDPDLVAYDEANEELDFVRLQANESRGYFCLIHVYVGQMDGKWFYKMTAEGGTDIPKGVHYVRVGK